MTDDELREKFHNQAEKTVSSDEVDRLVDMIDDLEWVDYVISTDDLTTDPEVDEEDLGSPAKNFDTPDMGGQVDPSDWGDTNNWRL